MSALQYTTHLRRYRWRAAASVAAGVGIVVAGIGLMASSGYLITRAGERPPILDLMVVVVAVRFFALSRAGVRYLERLVSHDLTFRILRELRVALYRAIEPLAPARIDFARSGDLLRRFMGDVETMQNAWFRVYAPVAVAGLASLLAAAALLAIEPVLVPVLLLFLTAAAVGGPALQWRFGRRIAARGSRLEAARHTGLVDLWQGLADVLTLNRLEPMRDRAARFERLWMKNHRHRVRLDAIAESLHMWSAHAGTWTIPLLLIPSVTSGALSGPLLVLVVFGVMTSFEAVQSVGTAWLARSDVAAARRRIESLAEEDDGVDGAVGAAAGAREGVFSIRVTARDAVTRGVPGPADIPGRASVYDSTTAPGRIVASGSATPAGPTVSPGSAIATASTVSPGNIVAPGRTIIRGSTTAPMLAPTPELAFEAVSFGYRPDAPVLRDVSFTVLPGAHMVVVGPSGSGKSTLAQLAVRFRDPDAGRITIGGIDTGQMLPEAVRSLVSLVTQQVHLFSGSVRDNLRIARPEADDEALLEALRRAALDDRIAALPDGLDTPVGEMGVQLSGGERRRLALARAILRDAPILILDEITAGVDPPTADALGDAIMEMVGERSVLVITHRLHRMAHYDEILVLESGRVVERGRHETLVAANGRYARMIAMQRDVM